MIFGVHRYLLRGAPELASVIQALYGDSRNDSAAPVARLVLCGSTFTIMSELLSGARPLRGRSRLDLMVPPFDYRTAREFWGIADQEVAMRLHAVLGGTPGYRDLTDSVPQPMVELDRWLVGHVLNPAHALFGETDYLLREDPTITDRALYQSVLAAIADGQTTPGGIAAALGRDARSLWHPLNVLRARTCCGHGDRVGSLDRGIRDQGARPAPRGSGQGVDPPIRRRRHTWWVRGNRRSGHTQRPDRPDHSRAGRDRAG